MSEHTINISQFKERYSYDPKADLIQSVKQTKTYRAISNSTGNTVLLTLYQGRELGQELFIAEATQSLSYEHPHIVQYLDFLVVKSKNFLGEESTIFVSAEEYVNGISLQQWMESSEKTTDPKVLNELITGFLAGLQYLHDGGITHGNIIPKNILLEAGPNGYQAKLANYGFTKLFHAKKSSSGNLIIGTSGYMPPEKITATQASSSTSNADLWGFGVILYEILTDSSPFGSKKEGYTLGQIFDNILKERTPKKLIELPAIYQKIVSACLRADPDHRVQSANLLLELLEPPKPVAPQKPERKKALSYARVIMLGDGKVGKTSLIRAITDKELDPEQDMTTGIEITPLDLEIGKHVIQANLWDFGGQEIMHSTHQFFMSERSVYVLVWDARRDDNQGVVEDWLHMIRAFGGDSPAIVVINQCDVRSYSLNEGNLIRKFPSIRTFVNTSCKTKEGIADLLREIQEAMQELPHLKNRLPESWLEVKKELESLEDSYLDFRTYRKICAAHGVEAEAQDKLLRLLHDLGLMLNFRDEATLLSTTILKPSWIIHGVYAIINHDLLAERKGLIATAELKTILEPREFPPETHMMLTGLMHKFQMCFTVGIGKDHLLFPASLPDNQPEYAWDEKQNLIFEYRYNFLPKSIFPRFIVRMQSYVEGDLLWRTGIVLYGEETRTEIIEDRKEKRIRIRIVGKSDTKMLFMVRNKFAEIHQQFSNLAVKELLPCNCDTCKGGEQAYFFDYQFLLKIKEKGITDVLCEKSIERISVNGLMREFLQQEKKQAAAPVPEPVHIERTAPNDFSGFVTRIKPRKSINTILFVASNPINSGQLRLGEELRRIDEGLRMSPHRERFDLRQTLATRPADFQDAVLEIEPAIVHFSGHGTDGVDDPTSTGSRSSFNPEGNINQDGGLLFENDDGYAQTVDSEALGGLFRLFSSSVRCVLLNACYSQNQAQAIGKHVPYVIGMSRAIPDDTAIAFAVGFYKAIASGKDIEFSFEFAKNRIQMKGLSGSDIPVLLK